MRLLPKHSRTAKHKPPSARSLPVQGDPLLSIEGLRVVEGGRTLVEVPSLDVAAGETLVIVGPNGAGKSTLLYALAGLRPPATGRLVFRGEPVSPPTALWYRRRLAVVMQAPLLLDTSVARNVEVGLIFRRLSRAERRARVERWLRRLGIAHLRDRPAHALSGGEAQRVALARALATEPDLLFLDEPFAALDTPTRQRLLDELFELLRETGQTTIMVTHDRNEALVLADRVAVMLAGRIRQVDVPERVFTRPADEEVAAFVGVENVLDATVVGEAEGLVSVRVGHTIFQVAATGYTVGRRVRLAVRPEDITLWPGTTALPPSTARNAVQGHVARWTPAGFNVRVTVNCDGFDLVVLITRRSREEFGLEPGTPVLLTFKATAAHLIG